MSGTDDVVCIVGIAMQAGGCGGGGGGGDGHRLRFGRRGQRNTSRCRGSLKNN